MHTSPALSDVARWLHQRFEKPAVDFEKGRSALRDALAGRLDCSDEEADGMLDELERSGYLRYAAEGRSPGSAGQWIVYTSPENNADAADDNGS